MLTYSSENMLPQAFPFRKPLMNYIFENINAYHLQKLYKTSKFFYNKFRLNIIEDFELYDEEKENERIVGNSMAIWRGNPSYEKLNNLWICNSFCLFKQIGENDELEYGKFARMTYTRVEMQGTNSVEEFEFLLHSSPFLRDLIIDGEICDSVNKRNLSFEECIERAPQVSTIDLDLYDIPPIDMTKLLSVERQTKLKAFHIRGARHIPDSSLVVQFFKKHAVPEIDYSFSFNAFIPPNTGELKSFFNAVDAELRTWKASLSLPPLSTPSSPNLTGKIALIIGAAEGIGKAATILFRQLGASVIAVSRNNGYLKNLVIECENIKTEGFIHTVWCNVTDDSRIDLLFQYIYLKFGSNFDILINNPDYSSWHSIEDEYVNNWFCDIWNVVRAQFRIFEHARKYVFNANRCTVNISAANGKTLTPNDEKRLKAFEARLLTSNIRINLANPGLPAAELPRPNGMNNIDYKKFLKNSKKIREQKVAEAIAHLAYDVSANGKTVEINAME